MFWERIFGKDGTKSGIYKLKEGDWSCNYQIILLFNLLYNSLFNFIKVSALCSIKLPFILMMCPFPVHYRVKCKSKTPFYEILIEIVELSYFRGMKYIISSLLLSHDTIDIWGSLQLPSQQIFNFSCILLILFNVVLIISWMMLS